MGNLASGAEAVACELVVPAQPRPVQRERLGINLNYLEDGVLLAPEDGLSLVQGLRGLGVRSLRYPGGNKSDSHLWSVPPFERPAPRLAVTGDWDWPAMEPRLWDRAAGRFARDVLDTDEALALAEELEAELVMVVPYDEIYPNVEEEAGRFAAGPSRDELIATAVAWVRYCRDSGHPVRYWEIGNETYFHDSITAERYAADLIRFATAMKAADPNIRIGANGPDMPNSRGKADERLGREDRWWPTVLAAASAHIDYLSLHQYPCWEWRSFAAYASKRPAVLKQLRAARRAIDSYAAGEDRARIKLLVTEANAADWQDDGGWPNVGDIGHALVLFDMLAQYLACDDLVTVQVWNTRWINHRDRTELWDALAADNRPSTIGQALALWARARSHWLEPAAIPGVVVVATHDPASGALTVFLLNRSSEPKAVRLEGAPLAAAGALSAQTWSGSDAEDLAPRFGPRAPLDGSVVTVPGAGMLIVEGAGSAE
ncbi:MAG: hypothetical protein PF961_15940 [Planctomycetota bacterium]|nr:hypothetical protein [Planctomycetota bacterium]